MTLHSTWCARIVSNQQVSNNWYAVIQVNVAGKRGAPVRITSLAYNSSWAALCLTGTKPNLGPYFCEFSPLPPGRYRIVPLGLGVSATITVRNGYEAIIQFER